MCGAQRFCETTWRGCLGDSGEHPPGVQVCTETWWCVEIVNGGVSRAEVPMCGDLEACPSWANNTIVR